MPQSLWDLSSPYQILNLVLGSESMETLTTELQGIPLESSFQTGLSLQFEVGNGKATLFTVL